MWGYEELTAEPLNDRWDPPEFADDVERMRFKAIDLGWIGEDADGVWLKQHPEVALLDQPALWDPVISFRHGQVELTPEDYRDLSNFHYESKLTLILAHKREERRQLKRDADGQS